jgi:hypothetical protein
MKFRDLLRFSLELFLPQRALVAFARRATGAREASEAHPQARTDAHTSTGHSTTRGIDSTKHDGSTSDSRPLIAELDSAYFGGPSFGEQSIAMMAEALDDVLAALPAPVAMSTKRKLAAKSSSAPPTANGTRIVSEKPCWVSFFLRSRTFEIWPPFTRSRPLTKERRAIRSPSLRERPFSIERLLLSLNRGCRVNSRGRRGRLFRRLANTSWVRSPVAGAIGR